MPPRPRRPTQPGLAAAVLLAENVTGIIVPPSGIPTGSPASELLTPPQVRRSARLHSDTSPVPAPHPRKRRGKAQVLDAPAFPPVPSGYGMSGVGPFAPAFPPPVALEHLAAHPNVDTATDFDIYAWVRWDESPSQCIFSVTTRSTNTIFTVKKLVLELNQNTLRGVEVSDLILWKPKDPIPFKDADERVNSLPYYLADVAEELPGNHLVGDYFSEFTSHLHIIVEPISGEWHILTDFWHTLWHHDRDVSPQIPFFERCTVQRDGSRPDILLPTKCWTLQLPRDVARQLPFGIMTILVRDDYMEALKELFLSACWADPQLPETLDSVDEFENPFLDRPQEMPGDGTEAFVLTGHPGIGKSIWLLIVLVLRLNARLPTIYQFTPESVIFFHENGVQIFDTMDSVRASRIPDGVWALVDSNHLLPTVDLRYIWKNIFVVQTPSPRPDRLEWTKKVLCNMFFLQPWSQSELLCARNFQTTLCSESQLVDFIVKYGPSAHLVYSYSDRPDEYESELKNTLANLDLARLIDYAHELNLGHAILHRLFVTHPAVPRRDAIFQLPSKHVRDLLIEIWKKKTQGPTENLYSVFVQRSVTRSCARMVLEQLVDDDLHKSGVQELVMMKKEMGPNNVLWNIPNVDGAKAELRISAAGFSITDHTAVATHSSTSLTSLIAFHLFSGDTILSESGYYQPTSGSQVTFDAFLYDVKDKHAALIQATVSERHEVKKEGFEQLKAKGVQTFSYIAVTPRKEKLQLWFPRAEEETWPVTRGWYQLEWMV